MANRLSRRRYYGGVALVLLFSAMTMRPTSGNAAETKAAVTFSGGHEIGDNDFGRPVTLIAAALGVEPDVFRQAFSGVTPARGRAPSGDEARRNKTALMKVLSPHGVTNERLDEVSDYYRYQPQRGALWPTKDAKAYAVVEDGKITKFVISEPGTGYCSPPEIKVDGFSKLKFEARLSFSKDLRNNGGVAAIQIVEEQRSTR